MTECFEVAENLPPLPRGATLDDARRVVRELMPGATETIIDNVAQAYWEIWACKTLSDQTISVQALAEALRSAKPHAPFGPRADYVRAQIIGWRYAVTRVADVLQKELPDFDRASFNKACGAD